MTEHLLKPIDATWKAVLKDKCKYTNNSKAVNDWTSA